jgi:hypothetical protein
MSESSQSSPPEADDSSSEYSSGDSLQSLTSAQIEYLDEFFAEEPIDVDHLNQAEQIVGVRKGENEAELSKEKPFDQPEETKVSIPSALPE